MNVLKLILTAALLCASARARVVINEVFYNAPEQVEELEYIELHNASNTALDLTGWRFSKGIKFAFPPRARIEASGFLVLCRNAKVFAEFYQTPVAATFNEKLSNDGEAIELSDASGAVVDRMEYSDRLPWPVGPDGLSGSLERISPFAPGEDPANWTSSPLSPGQTKPSGTPGKVNASYSPEVPPVISSLKFSPEIPAPGQPINVTAELRETNNAVRVTLLFKTFAGGEESGESSLPMRAEAPGKFTASIPGQLPERVLRLRVGARTANGASRFFPDVNEPRPALSTYIANPPQVGKIPLAHILTSSVGDLGPRRRRWGGPRRVPEESPATPHLSAFIYFDPAIAKYQVFDFVQVSSRNGGWKVRLNKDQMLGEISTLNISFENERGTLAEPLAYELYRRAGMAASLSWHVRLTMNGQPMGYHLAFEQPNRAFLRRNKIDDTGNMYKILWYEQGVVGQHEKKTNTRDGHQDIIALVRAIENSAGDAQWEIIKKSFDVKQVATYFAVNTVLSHWDGFFNNYFTYHDVNGSGKWTIYPWDQDQTWGILNHEPGSVFYQMPVTFGMNGDSPAGFGRGRNHNRFGFGDGPSWWRPPGYFSGPLLANPKFRPLFLARTREILENVYTEEKMFPVIDGMADRLRDEVKFRSQLSGGDPKWELQQFETNIRGFKTHLTKRRQYLLAQQEIKTALRMP
jgi:hypothetical protein